MTYFFTGVFILGDGVKKIAQQVCAEFGGRAGEIEHPTPASVVAFGADEEWFEAPSEFDLALVRFSEGFPNRTFIRLHTICWGGAIDLERGEVFRSGKVLGKEHSEEESVIVKLFAHAGVRLESGFLQPLTRDWFEGKGDRNAALDRTYMRVALEVARLQIGATGDNPSVGCVLREPHGRPGTIAFAATADGGRPHAEERALEQAGERARGASAYVTLEPCAKRTSGAPSCADLLIQAGIARVVIAARDPHPFASGVGIERLQAAGISVEVGLLAEEARAQNPAFFAKWSGS